MKNNISAASDLGPLLFLIFINDLPLYIQNSSATVDFYVDGTTFYCSRPDKLMLERNLAWNSHLNFLSKMLSSYMWPLSKIRTYIH